MIESLWNMSRILFSDKKQIMSVYKKNCITLGKEIQVIQSNRILPGKAIDLDEDGGLLVIYADGSSQTVSSGEVSVRGMYGYV